MKSSVSSPRTLHLFMIATALAMMMAQHAMATYADCASLANTLDLGDVNATVLSARFYTAGSTVQMNGEQAEYCQNATVALVDICRVVLTVYTSTRSSAYTEVWLPTGNHDEPWSGRMMSTGNPGLSGCIEYDNVAYATSLGFATVGDNGGHNGTLTDGSGFLNNKDAVLDFSYRARHASNVVGKKVCQRFYGQKVRRAYHFGCSNAGRQGHKMAQMFPDDFDGILSGAPALDFNHLASWVGHFLTITGVNETDPRFLTRDQWALVHDEIMRQCDTIDGVADGIIEDSTICAVNPEPLLCTTTRSGGTNDTNTTNSTCLTMIQTQTVRNAFTPLYGLNNTFLFPRFSPGAELIAATPLLFPFFTGDLHNLGATWYQNAIYNDPAWDPTTLNPLDYIYADAQDNLNGQISTFSGNLSAFQSRGGKLLTYHGGTDSIIADGISLRYYRHVASTMNLSSTELDEFYRLFPISGMEHCLFGKGAWAFGQEAPAAKAGYNIITALVDWVEKDQAPDPVVGTKWVDDDASTGVVELERAHCRYPYRTTYFGAGDPRVIESWNCTLIEDWDRCGGPSDRLPQLC